MSEEDMRLCLVIYEIQLGAIVVESLFGGFSSNVCAAKTASTHVTGGAKIKLIWTALVGGS